VEELVDLEALCARHGLRMTDQRRVIVRVLTDAIDHPDIEELYQRSVALDKKVSMATVYRTVRIFEEAGLLERHEFRDNRTRFEPTPKEHHDHLIDVDSGNVIEFYDDELEALQLKIADRLGYVLTNHRMELYGVPKLSPA
jgi:Fur family transcriptional regulator, ferric uptake regulator